MGPTGQLESVTLSGSARVQHPRGNIAADTIEAKAIDASGSFALTATGQVAASAPSPKGPSTLTCDAVRATLDAKGVARDGLASGNVRFDGEGTAGRPPRRRSPGTWREARSRYARRGTGGRAWPRGGPGWSRETIVSDVHGAKLTAEGRVESTMLPAPRNQPSGMSPMFTATEAVHFVSASLESESGVRVCCSAATSGRGRGALARR